MKIAIWTDNDLDGAGSALAIKHLYKDKAEVFIKEVNDFEFSGLYRGWFRKEESQFDKIFITDLFVPDDILGLVDSPKVVVIDHHQSHLDVKDRYKKAKVLISVATSCTKLIVERLKISNLSPELSKLISIIDDYDSYVLAYPESLKLNAVYHAFNKPKVEKFIDRFKNGFDNFTPLEQNVIKIYFNKYKDVIDNSQFYIGELKGYKVVSTFADTAINEVAHYSLKKFSADIAIVVNLNTKSVSFRKNKTTCKLPLDKLASALCNGGGHEYAAGGKITDKFASFTKTLQLCL
jgi:oligoribonuclease NrnB/cAMP/cGMP phosphodiesterase (DHH superfamily)